MKTLPFLLLLVSLFLLPASLSAFEGRITAVLTRGGDTQNISYAVGPGDLRIARTETNWPHAINLIHLASGDFTLVFPHNRSFVRVKPAPAQPPGPPGFPALPALPPGIGPQTQPPSLPGGTGPPGFPGAVVPSSIPALPPTPGLPPGIGPQGANNFPVPVIPPIPAVPGIPAPSAGATPGAPALPQIPAVPPLPAGLPPGIGPQAGGNPAGPQAPSLPGLPAMPKFPAAAGMPAMPMMPMPGDKLELEATTETKTILGFACVRYHLKRRGEIMEIWATDKLLPFQAWQQSQPPRFGPRMIEEQWPGLMKERKLFPLLAVLKFEGGTERMRFEVKSITPEKIEDREGKLFQPPPDYHQLEPLPF